MLRSKVYDPYYPYSHGGDGIEYELDKTEEDKIDYEDYYHSSFDLFWNGLLERLSIYKNAFPDKVTKDDQEEISLTKIQTTLLEIFKEQREHRKSDPYFCYVDLDSSKFRENFMNKELIEFLINQNKYIKDLEGGKKQVEDLLPEDISYKNVKFYMGVDSFEDLNGNTINKFHYYEFKFKKRYVQHKITRLIINGPIGTTFYLNRSLNLILIHKYQQSNIINSLKGEYVLEPEEYVDIKYVTFPKYAIPEYKTCLNEKYPAEGELTRDIDTAKDLYWTVSYIYDDDYDVEYSEEE